MPITCGECGEELTGDTCMLCGWTAGNGMYVEVAPGDGVTPRTETPATNTVTDDQQSGTLGDSRLDISRSIRIMDLEGHTIFDIPFDSAECSIDLFGALCIKHGGTKTRLKGPDVKAWRRAIQYRQNTPTWYLHGDEDCAVLYGDCPLGVTPCLINPPFSWEAFRSGSYDITISRPGGSPVEMKIQCKTCSPKIKYTGGEPAVRTGERPQGDELVLNSERKLVIADKPYLVDGDGAVVLPMPNAYADIKFLKRGATISWEQKDIGRISIPVHCNNKLKYDRLAQMLPKPKNIPKPKKKKFSYNGGVYEGVDLCITQNDLDTKLGRFDGYAFEAVCANVLAATGYTIQKGYDVRSGKMLGATKADKGVDVLAVKGEERITVQCKLWQNQCGGPDVNKTIGAASTQGGNAVLMICTGGFTSQAIQISKEAAIPVLLWDWAKLRSMMQKYLL